MTPALLDQVLQGDADAIARFGQSEYCAVVDWRHGLAEIVDAVSHFLPAGYLRLQADEGTSARLIGGTQAALEVPHAMTKQEELIALVNRALMPDFELRQFRPVDGDSYSLRVAPAAEWADIQRKYPDATERNFLSADRLAAYWRKSYFARLLSKP